MSMFFFAYRKYFRQTRGIFHVHVYSSNSFIVYSNKCDTWGNSVYSVVIHRVYFVTSKNWKKKPKEFRETLILKGKLSSIFQISLILSESKTGTRKIPLVGVAIFQRWIHVFLVQFGYGHFALIVALPPLVGRANGLFGFPDFPLGGGELVFYVSHIVGKKCGFFFFTRTNGSNESDKNSEMICGKSLKKNCGKSEFSNASRQQQSHVQTANIAFRFKRRVQQQQRAAHHLRPARWVGGGRTYSTRKSIFK